MSGIKSSKIEFEAEQRARQKALGRIRELSGVIEAQKNRIQALVAQLSEGIKESFPGELERARRLLEGRARMASSAMDSIELNRIARDLEHMSKEGTEVLALLIDIKEVRREQRARHLMRETEALKAEFGGITSLVNKWKATEASAIANAFDEVLSMIEMDRFTDAEKRISMLRKELTRIREEVTTLEEQDSQRWYVLECLRKVCREMGWGETQEPHLEGETPDSAILYQVNTYSSGRMLFRLTLEGIRVHSPITTEHNACYRQFDHFSQKLRKFGVITKFKRVEVPDEEPKLIQKGELDFPDEGMAAEMEA